MARIQYHSGSSDPKTRQTIPPHQEPSGNICSSVHPQGAARRLQPVEEDGAGALKMIERGVLNDPNVDWVLACHMLPELEVGRVGGYGCQSHASADSFRLTINGVGAHGGRPHQGRDPIVAAAHRVTAVQTVGSRNIDPVDSAVVTVGRFNSGDAYNVIPAKVELAGTTRAIDEGARAGP